MPTLNLLPGWKAWLPSGNQNWQWEIVHCQARLPLQEINTYNYSKHYKYVIYIYIYILQNSFAVGKPCVLHIFVNYSALKMDWMEGIDGLLGDFTEAFGWERLASRLLCLWYLGCRSGMFWLPEGKSSTVLPFSAITRYETMQDYQEISSSWKRHKLQVHFQVCIHSILTVGLQVVFSTIHLWPSTPALRS